MGLKKIINSGQLGTEQGALASAFKSDCPTGGFIPEGYRVGRTTDKSLKLFNLTEAPNSKLGECIIENIKISDGTVIFVRNLQNISNVEQFTLTHCEWIGKPFLKFPLNGSMSVNSIRKFLTDHKISYLHITGGLDTARTNYMFKFVFRTIGELLDTLISETKYDKTRDNFVTANRG